MNTLNPNVEQIFTLIEKTSWPSTHRNNTNARKIYLRGVDLLNYYTGDPMIFVEALKLFLATESAPYAYAGISATLAICGSIYDSSEHTTDAALEWIEKAQEWEPDKVDINVIEALIYIYAGELDNGRTVIDYLKEQQSNHYLLAIAEVRYWWYADDKQKYAQWIQKAHKLADNDLRKVHLLHLAANIQERKGAPEKAIALYSQITELNPNDPWAWHNMSCMHLNLDNLKAAKSCNQKALAIMDFVNARNVQAEIEEKSKFGFMKFLKR